MQPLHASIYTDQSYDLANVNVARLEADDAHEGNLVLKSAIRLFGIGVCLGNWRIARLIVLSISHITIFIHLSMSHTSDFFLPPPYSQSQTVTRDLRTSSQMF